MKTKYKYIYFVKFKYLPKTSAWECYNIKNGSLLGEVKWYGPWRQYSFFPIAHTIFNKSCLEDINHFIGQLTDQRKDKT